METAVVLEFMPKVHLQAQHQIPLWLHHHRPLLQLRPQLHQQQQLQHQHLNQTIGMALGIIIISSIGCFKLIFISFFQIHCLAGGSLSSMFFHSIPHPEKTRATVLGSFNKCECEGGGVHVCKYIFVQIFATFCKHLHVHIYVQPNMCIPTNVSAFALAFVCYQPAYL